VTGVPVGANVEIKGIVTNLVNGSTVTLQHGKNYKSYSTSYTYTDSEKGFGPVDCHYKVLNFSATFCDLTISTPPETMVNIVSGPQGLRNGETVSLPNGIDVGWVPSAQGQVGTATNFKVSKCAKPLDTITKLCALPVTIPTGGMVITSAGTNLTKGMSFWLVKDVTTTFNWYGAANGQQGAGSTHTVLKCATPLVTTGAFCDMSVSAMHTIDVSGGPQVMATGYKVLFPKGPSVTWRTNYFPTMQGFKPWALSKPIACSDTTKPLDSEGVRTATWAPETE
jgi:hypothetical protein